jgi:hypothetical protein
MANPWDVVSESPVSQAAPQNAVPVSQQAQNPWAVVSQAPVVAAPKPTFEGLYQDKDLIARAKRFYGLTNDKEAIDQFIDDRTWKDSNTVSMVRELYDASTADQERKEDLAILQRKWEELPSFWQEGGRGLTGLAANVWRGLLDPTALAGGFVGRGAAAGATRLAAKPLAAKLAGTAAGVATDAAVTAGGNLLQQQSQIEVGNRDQISVSEAAVAGAAGGALSGGAAYVGSKLAGTKINPFNRQPDLYGEHLATLPANDRALIEGSRGSVTVGDSPGFFFVSDTRNGALVTREFRSADEANAYISTLPAADQEFFRAHEGVNPSLTLRDKMANALSRLTNSGFDATKAIKNVAEKGRQYVRGTDLEVLDAHMFTKNSLSESSIVEMALYKSPFEGQFRFNTTQGFKPIEGSKSLETIFDPLRDAGGDKLVADFGRWFFYRRLIGIEAGVGGRKHYRIAGMHPGAHLDVFNLESQYGNLFNQVADDMKKFNENFVGLMQDLNMIDAVGARRILDTNPFYLPIKRLEKDKIGLAGEAITEHSQTTIRKYMEGVGEEHVSKFADPIRAYKDNLNATIRAGINNERLRRIASTLESMPVEQRLRFGDVFVDKPAFDWIDPKKAITFFDGGQKKRLSVHDEQLVSTLDFFASGGGTKLSDIQAFGTAQMLTSMFQYAITRDPQFVIGTSFPTDSLTAAIYSSNWKNLPVLNTLRGAYLQATDNKLVKEAMANGALAGNVIGNENDTLIRKFFHRYGIATDNVWGLSHEQDQKLSSRIVMGLTQMHESVNKTVPLNRFAEGMEASPRLTGFKMAQDAGMTPAQAGYKAMSENIDFRLRGTNQALNIFASMLPFMNAAKNVLYRQGQMLADSKQMLGPQGAKLAGLTGMITALYALNADNPDYQGLHDHEKQLFFHFYLPGDVHIKVRKSDDLAIWGNAIETFLRETGVKGRSWDQATLKSLGMVAERTVTPFRGENVDGVIGIDTLVNFVPFPAQPFAEAALNTAGGRPVVPEWMERDFRDTPEQKYREGQTSPLLVQLSEKFGLAPMKVQHVLRSTLGPLASYGIDAERLLNPDMTGRIHPDMIPIVRKFWASDRPRSFTSWSEEFEKIRKETEGTEGRIKGLEKFGRIDALEKDITRVTSDPVLANKWGMASYFNNVGDTVGQLRGTMRLIESDKDTAPQAKERDIQELQAQINLLQETAVRVYYATRAEARGASEQTVKALEEAVGNVVPKQPR